MIDITVADRGMIRAVIAQLRDDDRREMEACAVDFDLLPNIIVSHKLFAFCAYDLETGPVAVWGVLARRPGVCAGFAFGTDQWGAALRPMLRQIRQFVLPFLVQAGIHRVEAAALADRDDVARFMELIGAEAEGVLQGYGSERENFISYRWLADEYQHQAERAARSSQNLHTAH
jgi:hypothetical protein